MEYPVEPDQILARTMYLLSRSASVGVCKGRLKALIEHLDYVTHNPQLPAPVREMCRQLAAEWRAAQDMHFGSGHGAALVH